jgi:hypothetical protein
MIRKKNARRTTALPAVTPIRDDDLREVAGGRKARGTQQEFLRFTLRDATITSVSSS